MVNPQDKNGMGTSRRKVLAGVASGTIAGTAGCLFWRDDDDEQQDENSGSGEEETNQLEVEVVPATETGERQSGEVVVSDSTGVVATNDVAEEVVTFDLVDGDYTVGVDSEEYEAPEQSVQLSGEDEEIEVELEEKTHQLIVTAVDSDEQDLRDVEVSVTSDGEEVDTENTGQDGEAVFELTSGEYDVNASTDGYIPTEQAVEVVDEDVEVDVRFEEELHELLITTIDTGSVETIDDAEVTIVHDEQEVVTGEVDDDGELIATVPDGTHTVEVEADGYEQHEETIEVDGEDKEVELWIDVEEGGSNVPLRPGEFFEAGVDFGSANDAAADRGITFKGSEGDDVEDYIQLEARYMEAEVDRNRIIAVADSPQDFDQYPPEEHHMILVMLFSAVRENSQGRNSSIEFVEIQVEEDGVHTMTIEVEFEGLLDYDDGEIDRREFEAQSVELMTHTEA